MIPLLDILYQKVHEAEANAYPGGLDFERPTCFISPGKFRELRRELHAQSRDGVIWTYDDEKGRIVTTFFDCAPCAGLNDNEVVVAPIIKLF